MTPPSLVFFLQKYLPSSTGDPNVVVFLIKVELCGGHLCSPSFILFSKISVFMY